MHHDGPEPTDGDFTNVFEAEIVPPKWIIQDLLPIGLTFIGAPPKTHKSGLTMAMAALTAGLKCTVLPPQYSKVLMGGETLAFSYEATAGELRHMLENGMGVKGAGGILVADNPFLFRLDDKNGPQFLLNWLDERKPRICILDPFRDFHSKEERDSGEMNRLLRPIRKWAVQNDSAVIVVHHTKKLDEARNYEATDLRGSTAFFAISDCVLMLTPVSDDATIHVKAVFKRAAGWERTIRLSIYDWQDRGEGQIVLAGNDQKVYDAWRDGHRTYTDIQKVTRIARASVGESLKALRRDGLIPQDFADE